MRSVLDGGLGVIRGGKEERSIESGGLLRLDAREDAGEPGGE